MNSTAETQTADAIRPEVSGSEAFYRTALESLSEGVMILDSDFGHEAAEGSQISRVEAKGCRLSSHCLDFADERFGLGLVRVIGEDSINTAPGKIEGSISADTPACASNDGCPVGRVFKCCACHIVCSVQFSFVWF